MIEVRDLTKKYGRFKAVDGLSFTIPAGEAVGLWGPNGAGKTTVMRCVLGLLRYQGRILIAGHDARRHGKRCRASIGYVPQELAFHDDLRVREALHFFARLRRVDRARPAQVLGQVGLQEHARKRIGELSGGMKQRLALALALLSDPPILLLDELTSNLDSTAQGAFLEALRQEKVRGRTILFTSHRLEEIELLADRVLGLEGGRLRHDCTPEEFSRRMDMRCTLRVVVAADAIDGALAALRSRAYSVARNGHGLLVEVGARDKAGPIQALLESQVAVQDFEIFNEPLGAPQREAAS